MGFFGVHLVSQQVDLGFVLKNFPILPPPPPFTVSKHRISNSHVSNLPVLITAEEDNILVALDF